jgi:ubiquinone/menaquinone biosynthesis C-methylase UbiE
MHHQLIGKSRLGVHILLAAVLVACAVVLAHWPSMWRAVAAAAATTFAAHAGFAIAIHFGVALTGTGVVLAAVRAHRRGHHNHGSKPGATLHSPRFYDWLAAAYCLGREGKMRERTLDLAGVAAGERVLDVCCGTGTLAFAAKERVGSNGSVHGIDASNEMIAYAKGKAARRDLAVVFDVAAAQSLPFPDASFDVVTCSLALHHLPEQARAGAIGEMQRVLKPGGRMMIVEFGKSRAASVLHPVALLHHRTAGILDRVVAAMRDAGFERVASGALGFAGLAYALAYRGSLRRCEREANGKGGSSLYGRSSRCRERRALSSRSNAR